MVVLKNNKAAFKNGSLVTAVEVEQLPHATSVIHSEETETQTDQNGDIDDAALNGAKNSKIQVSHV